MDFKLKPTYEISEDKIMDAIEHVYGVNWRVAYAIVKEYFCRVDKDGWDIDKYFLKYDIGTVHHLEVIHDPNLIETIIKLFADANPNGYYSIFSSVDLLTDDSIYKGSYFEKDPNEKCPKCGSRLLMGEIIDIVDGKILRDEDVCVKCDYESDYSYTDISNYKN